MERQYSFGDAVPHNSPCNSSTRDTGQQRTPLMTRDRRSENSYGRVEKVDRVLTRIAITAAVVVVLLR
jgi:hypothetical protein